MAKRTRKEPLDTEIKNIELLVISEGDILTPKELEKLSRVGILDYQANLHDSYCMKCPIKCESSSAKGIYCVSTCKVGKSINSLGEMLLSSRKPRRK